MGHLVRHARIIGIRLGFSLPALSWSGVHASSGIGECRGSGSIGGLFSDVVHAFLGSRRDCPAGGCTRLVLQDKGLLPVENLVVTILGARPGLRTLQEYECSSAALFSRSYSSIPVPSSSSFSRAAGVQATIRDHGIGFRLSNSLLSVENTARRGDRGYAKAVALPPQMQKPMRLRVYMGSPGVIGEPWKPPPPPLPLLKRWFTREGWKVRKQNVVAMLRTGFTLAKLRQKTKGYSQSKFYRDATDLFKEINHALAQGDRSALRQLVTDNVLSTMKKELKHREQAWARVQWELVGPIKKIRTLQGRLIGIDQKNMDTAFAQLTLRIISNQKFAAYDKQGKLVAGDPEKELTVEDIWVFERQVSQPEARWRLCGRLST